LKDRIVWGSLLLAFLCSGAAGQSAATIRPPPRPVCRKRTAGHSPAFFRSTISLQLLQSYQPLTPGAKFRIATDDSIAPGTIVLAGLVAGESQWTNQNRSFGQGAAGFGRYFGAAYGDLVIGNLHDRGRIPNDSSRGPTLLPPRRRERVVEAAIRNRTHLLDTARSRWHRRAK
jgi:hypothetical protein